MLIIAQSGPEDRLDKQWKWDPTRRRLGNTELGAAYQVVDVVETVTGIVHHEGVVLLTGRTELHVVVRAKDGHLGFVLHRREKVICPEAADKFFAENPGHIPDPFALLTGIEEYECAHGLTNAPMQEVIEEIGLEILEGKAIGHIKDSPSLGGVAHVLYAVKVGEKPSSALKEPGEQILRVDFFSPEQVREISTICALTQAALWRFRCWGLQQSPSSFWRAVAERL